MHPALFHSSSPSQGHKTFDGHLRTYAAAYIHGQVGKENIIFQNIYFTKNC